MAITLYRAVSGRLPFSSTGPVETLIQRLKEDPEPLDWHCPDFPAPLKQVLMKALSRHMNDRFASTEQMLDAMKAACESCSIQWGKPLEGFEHLSVIARTPIEKSDYGFFDGTELTAASRVKRSPRGKPSIIFAVFAPMAAIAAFIALWLIFKTPPPRDHGQDLGAQPAAAAETQLYDDMPHPKPPSSAKPAGAPTKGQPPPAAKRTVAAHAVLKDENRPKSISVPPESEGKDIAVKVKVGEDGRVTECTILTPNLSDEEKRIVRAIALNMVFLPAKAEDGEPVVSEVIAGITL
jgi:serine/threonine-protein kinase